MSSVRKVFMKNIVNDGGKCCLKKRKTTEGM